MDDVEALVLETTFLVDLEREALENGPGSAHAFLERHPDAHLCISWTTAGELACGPGAGARDDWRRLIRRFQRIEMDEEVAWIYGTTWRFLRDNGLLIGANDLWIAAAALRADLPLVTRNEDEFKRVPGLRVLTY